MKINIDNFFRTKLNEVNFDFKPEYWDEMEKKIEQEGGSSISAGGLFGGTMSLVSKIAFVFTTLIIIYGLIYYFGSSAESDSSESNKQPVVKPVPAKVNSTAKTIETEKAIEKIPEQIITKTTKRKIVKKRRHLVIVEPCTEKPSVTKEIDDRLRRDVEIRFMNSFKLYNLGPLEYDMGQEVDIPVDPAVNNDDVNVSEPKKIAKPDNPKDYKPMQKPIKRVFGKKKGILYRLGLRK